MKKGMLTISQWGNSQAIRIPQAILSLLSLNTGDSLEVDIEDNRLVLTPANLQETYSLTELFKGYDGPVLMDPGFDDAPRGNELI